jgi:hypothetical protein
MAGAGRAGRSPAMTQGLRQRDLLDEPCSPLIVAVGDGVGDIVPVSSRPR